MPAVDAPAALQDRLSYVKAPGRDNIADNNEVAALVATILADVRARGDAAVREYSERFDRASRSIASKSPRRSARRRSTSSTGRRARTPSSRSTMSAASPRRSSPPSSRWRWSPSPACTWAIA